MKILRATIENYRSIEKLEVDLTAEAECSCRILAGINESGKSNVLKALALLSTDSKVTYSKDVNKKAKSEKKEISVTYELDSDSIINFLADIEVAGVPEEIIEKLNIEKIERVVSFDSSSARNDSFNIRLINKPSLDDYLYVAGPKTFIEEDKTPLPDASPVTPVADPAPAVPQPAVVAEDPEPPEEAMELETKEDWEDALGNFASDALEKDMPRVIFWAYNDEYLINKEINLTEFAATPAAISKPLHNVFNLAKFTDAQISAVISDALEDGAQMGELADKLEKTATDYLREVWPEHRVGIKVYTANPTISFQVIELDTPAGGRYEIEERSDGFKHFFAILLNLAAENSTSQLKDCLILLDEPEVHLHPSGAKFLRDELLKIAKHNTVVYSTHSIFMIDRACLDRHYKVYKENEITKVLKIDGSNPFKEELIYEALGTSILNLISEHNILFEGLTDQKLFEAFTYKFRMDIKPLSITAMSVDGESHFDKYCKFFNKKIIKGYIVADSDNEGVGAKSRILRDHSPDYSDKNTFVINDIVDTGKGSCVEDLLPKDTLQKCVEDFCGVTMVLDDSKTFSDQISAYNRGSASKIDEQKLKMFICDFVCNDITKSGMSKDKAKDKYPVYHQFIVNLHQKLKDANTT